MRLVGLFFLLWAGAAFATDSQETICDDSAVFFCDNFEARSTGASDLSSSHYKSPGFAKSQPSGSAQTIVAGVGYGGGNAFQFQYPNGNNTGAGFMTVDWPSGPYR